MPSPWTEEDQHIFKTAFPHVGAKGVHELLPHRSVSAIQQRAQDWYLHKLPKAQSRSLEELRAELQPKRKRMVVAPGGAAYEYGTTAGTKPGLEKVPETATHLPWVSYPRDPDTARAVAAACEYMAQSDVVKKIEAQRFFESQAEYLRALAERMDQKAAV